MDISSQRKLFVFVLAKDTFRRHVISVINIMFLKNSDCFTLQ